MRPQQSLFFSLTGIGLLLLMMVLPSETESTSAGWVGYGIIIGLLLSVVLRAFSTLSYERSYKRPRRTYTNRSRQAQSVLVSANHRFYPLLSGGLFPNRVGWHENLFLFERESEASYDLKRFTKCGSISEKVKCWADGSRRTDSNS